MLKLNFIISDPSIATLTNSYMLLPTMDTCKRNPKTLYFRLHSVKSNSRPPPPPFIRFNCICNTCLQLRSEIVSVVWKPILNNLTIRLVKHLWGQLSRINKQDNNENTKTKKTKSSMNRRLTSYYHSFIFFFTRTNMSVPPINVHSLTAMKLQQLFFRKQQKKITIR